MPRTDEQRMIDREGRVFRRPFYNKNRRVKKRRRKPVRADKKRRRRRYFTRPHHGWRITMKERRVDPALRAIIGVDRASWGDITRLIWQYVKDNNLQNPDNRRTFRIDETLAVVMGEKDQLWIDGFSMMKYIKPHILTE